MKYPIVPGTSLLDYEIPRLIAGESTLPTALTSPEPPLRGAKSIFAFWHAGIRALPPYLLRNVLSWYRRFSPLGWTVYVLDTVPGSALNISRFIDTSSADVVPAAFTHNTITGEYAAQHTSDLTRFPLLLKYGGVYMDVGILAFGDVDAVWRETVGAPSSPHDFVGFTLGGAADPTIVNFAFMCTPENPLVERAHRILLKLWQGRTHTAGMHAHPLLEGVPLMRVPKDTSGSNANGVTDEGITDYAIQIQAMSAAQRWKELGGGWDGPKYVREKAWLWGMLEGANVPEQLTGWDGPRIFALLSLRMPSGPGEVVVVETAEQRQAREIVEKSVAGSWCYKLSHGTTAKLFGCDTTGMLWRKHVGSDAKPGTYAGWMRFAMTHCTQDPDRRMKPIEVPVYEPSRVAFLEDFL